MLNGYTGTLVLALHLLPVVLLWATWKLPQEAAGSKIVLGQTLGSGVFLLLFPVPHHRRSGGPGGCAASGKMEQSIMKRRHGCGLCLLFYVPCVLPSASNNSANSSR